MFYQDHLLLLHKSQKTGLSSPSLRRYLQVKEQEVDFVTMGTEDASGVELLHLRSPPLTFGQAPSLCCSLLSDLDRKVETQKIDFGGYHILSHGKLTMSLAT